jgi:GT2 family glycosyltransferase
MDLSVIIAVRNRPRSVRRCVKGVLACDYPREKFEVIVVDNGSRDSRTAQAAQSAGARVIQMAGANRCLARNLGARSARGRWLAFTDSDCVPHRGWLAALARAAARAEANPNLALLAGPLRPARPRSYVESYIVARRWIDQENFLARGRRFSPPFAATANLAVRRQAWEELGGLDPNLTVAGEDADFCWRARRIGFLLQYVPEAAVVHHHRARLASMLRQAYRYGIGNADLFAKWRVQWGARAWFEPAIYMWAIKGAIKAPIRLVIGRDPLTRRLSFYDLLANSAMALGRARGGLRRRVIVI